MRKEIYYIDYYVQEKRQGTIGFVRVGMEKVEIVLRNVPLHGETTRNVYLLTETQEEKCQLTQIVLKEGMGQAQMSVNNIPRLGKNLLLRIPITNSSFAICSIENKNIEPREEESEKYNAYMTEMNIVSERVLKSDEVEKETKVEPIIEIDKWKQICKIYPNVHIFPQAQSVLIKPENMVLLRRDYHGLASNSFLLHAYYNYRQLLLIREERGRYYLGVPGVYYERERQLAALYGFSQFENGEARLENGDRREIYAGCFGYYKIQVDI